MKIIDSDDKNDGHNDEPAEPHQISLGGFENVECGSGLEGQHRMIVDDCVNIASHLPTESVSLLFTSPPYANNRKYDKDSGFKPIPPEEYSEWMLARTAEFGRVLKQDGSFVLNIKEGVVDGQRQTYVMRLVLDLVAQGWCYIENYSWIKTNPCPGKWPNHFRDGQEHIFHFAKQRRFKIRQEAVMVEAGEWSNKAKYEDKHNIREESRSGTGFGRKRIAWKDRELVYPSNVLHFAVETAAPGHPAPFPKGLPLWFMKLLSDPGDLVVDPFAGSGTTNVAAVELDRRSVGFEISEKYSEYAENRIRTAVNARLAR